MALYKKLDVNKRFGCLKMLIFSILPLVSLLFFGEFFCRIKLYLNHKDLYYLTAPFFRRPDKKLQEKKPVEYKFDWEHFNEDETYKGEGCWGWYHGPDWYYKIKPGYCAAQYPFEHGHYTNSLGFRGKEFKPLDKGERMRVFCIGESSTFGMESPDDWTWPARLEYYLNQNKKNEFEVINSGFGGYCSLNILNIIRYELVKYKPDMFIIYAGFNDINHYRHIEKRKVNEIINALHNLLYYKSMLYTILIEKISTTIKKNPTPVIIYKDNYREDFLGNMENILKLCQAHNIKLVFVLQFINVHPNLFLRDDFALSEAERIQESPPKKDSYGIDYAPTLQAYRHNDLMKSLKEFCTKYNIEFMDFRKEIDVAIKSNKRVFFDVIHLTSEGNDLLAKLISNLLLDRKILLHSYEE